MHLNKNHSKMVHQTWNVSFFTLWERNNMKLTKNKIYKHSHTFPEKEQHPIFQFPKHNKNIQVGECVDCVIRFSAWIFLFVPTDTADCRCYLELYINTYFIFYRCCFPCTLSLTLNFHKIFLSVGRYRGWVPEI